MAALTFDTGALIALSRGDERMRALLVAEQERRAVITVPAVVVADGSACSPRATTDSSSELMRPRDLTV